MRKDFSETGPNGRIDGYVEVRLQASSQKINVHNPSTHEDQEKLVYYTHVFIWDSKEAQIHKIRSEDEEALVNALAKAEQWLPSRLRELANEVPKKTLKELLTEKGYK